MARRMMRWRHFIDTALIISFFLSRHIIPFVDIICAIKTAVILKHSAGTNLLTSLSKSIAEIISIDMSIADTLIISQNHLLRFRNSFLLRGFYRNFKNFFRIIFSG